MALLDWPWKEHVTVAVPDDCMCQVHPTTPLLPTVCADSSNDRGACPVEYRTLALPSFCPCILRRVSHRPCLQFAAVPGGTRRNVPTIVVAPTTCPLMA